MTAGTPPAPISNGILSAPSPRLMAAVCAGLTALTFVAAQLSVVTFIAAAALLLGALAVATARWPKALLLVLVLSPPLIDLYAAERLLPEDVLSVARLFSEVLLLVVSVVIAFVAVRRGAFVAALRHPVTAGLAIFAGLGVVSAIVNQVPPAVAVAGLLFTLDAAVLFFLPRMEGYTNPEKFSTMKVVAIAVAVTAAVAIGQALLSPDLLGITPVIGRSGEGARVGSLVRDPNILGTLIGIGLPFTVYASVRAQGRKRWIGLVVVVVLLLALLLTYSRGSWLGVFIGFVLVSLVIDRRALIAFAGALLVAYVLAIVMPKGILGGLTSGFDPFATTVNRFENIPEGRDLRTLFILNAIPIVEEHPLLGVGPGNYGGAAAYLFESPIHDEYGTTALLTRQRTVDNFWLHLGVESGVLGTIAFLGTLGVALLAPVRALRRSRGWTFSVPAGVLSATLTVCAATVTTMLLEGNTVAFLFWFLLGLANAAGPGPDPGPDEVPAV
jgi:O-antigen ligase